MEFKSKQWFGACAPLYQWSTFGVSEREPVGTCYLKKGTTVVEYSPCRSSDSPEGQGFCQAGFSADFLKNNRVVVGGPGSFYWQGQLISDDVSEIFTRSNNGPIQYVTYSNTLATKSASAQYDDSYLGYSVTVGDFNNDGKDGEDRHTAILLSVSRVSLLFFFSLLDLLVGAPLFMDRGSDGKLRELGQASVYLSSGGFSFQPPKTLPGFEPYGRFGSAIAALGDLDMDGYNDVAVSAPYGGPDRNGLVYIYNGRSQGPDLSPSQVLQGRWASSYMPASFGYSMTGNTDIDQNGYPDLIVGVFGADKAVLYRARPVISVNATLDITPQIINPEEKNCTLPGTSTRVSCFRVKYCLKASGRGAPSALIFRVDLMLDRLKQKESTKRVFFLHSRTFQYSKETIVTNSKGLACEEQDVFLRDDQDFRDKITPISVVMEYSMDYQKAADKTGLLPILDMLAPSNVTKQAHILLDCGDDNICKPDLRLSVKSDREQIYIGDDNALTLEVSAENQGEGAYEAELLVYPPEQADFTGVIRKENLSRLSCAYKKENQTKMVVCDLGNPMKGGTKILAELRFSVHQLSEDDTSVKFDLQIVRYISMYTKYSICTTSAHSVDHLSCRSSSPGQVLVPIANWKVKEPPVVGDDIGPQIVHVYELLNSGPSTISKAALQVDWPYHFKNGSLLYITSYETEGPINCTTDIEINPLNVSVRNSHAAEIELFDKNCSCMDLTALTLCVSACLRLKCQVGRLERGKNAIIFIYSRLDVNNFLRPENQNRSYVVRSTASFSVIEMPYKNLASELPSNSTTVSVSVMWVADTPQPVPGWVVALAVLAGLLLLALLIFIMYKLGFFNRVRPPQEDGTEKEQLQPEENGNTDA
uniref:Integrin, alpha V n=1 Tax=Anabas testudineus TaxID=64144 RepID=A0A7N6FFC6_ANATE